MTALLSQVLGRVPIGWLQLTHNRGRLLAAIAGVTFANVLVFVQLGIMGSLNTTIVRDYEMFNADIMISSIDTNTLTEGSAVPRQWLFRALSVPAVNSASPLFIGTVDHTRDDGGAVGFRVFGFDPEAEGIMNEPVESQRDVLRVENTIIIDTRARGMEDYDLSDISPTTPLELRMGNQLLTARGTLESGGGFGADGNMAASDQTFLRLFPRRASSAPDHVLVSLRDGASVAQAVADLSELIPQDLARVRTVAAAATEDQIYQTTERPTGLIFGFGVVMGAIVGIVIVYQVLSTDVADHLREYATFKAMGYPQSFFLSIIFEEAVVLAVIGFIPGLLISLAAYATLNQLTGLPLVMDWDVALMVLLGTIAACTLSGAIATRRLASADPADLF